MSCLIDCDECTSSFFFLPLHIKISSANVHHTCVMEQFWARRWEGDANLHSELSFESLLKTKETFICSSFLCKWASLEHTWDGRCAEAQSQGSFWSFIWTSVSVCLLQMVVSAYYGKKWLTHLQTSGSKNNALQKTLVPFEGGIRPKHWFLLFWDKCQQGGGRGLISPFRLAPDPTEWWYYQWNKWCASMSSS